jgi:uncharacterized protein DUF4105
MPRAASYTLVFLLFSLGALADAAAEGAGQRGDVQALMRQAKSRNLATHPYWLALLHYRRTASGKVASEIFSPEFFASPEGAIDPTAELDATLAAFFESPAEQPDSHAQCRFIARYKWLRKSLDWGSLTPPAIPCPGYSAYTMNERVESLSLVFATGYLSNPASFYGHILLKFNTRRSLVATDLLDQSLNFGAVIPSNENAVVYVIKGVFGGYDASFSHQRFYNFNHAYAENELRDMWEYVLELSTDEVEQIVAHSWELLGKRFEYFFLKENCAYRMAELLELVIGQPLLPDLPWSLPGAVFERLAALKRDGAPIVREVRWIPSRQNRFRNGYLAMTQEQRSIARELAEHPGDLNREGYEALPTADKVAVVDMLLDYYEYRIIADPQEIELKRAKQALLIERSGLPARAFHAHETGSPPSASVAAPPHEGPLPFMVRGGLLRNSHFGSGLLVRIRPVNYDHLSLDAARIPHSYLAMFDLKLVHLESRLRLRALDFVNIENLNVARTPLPKDAGLAWKFKVGLESNDLECRHCTVFRLEGGLGKAASIGRNVLVFGMLDLIVQSEHANSGSLAAAPRIGLVASPVDGWKTYLSTGRQRFLNGVRSDERVVRWENRFGNGRKWDVRLAYEENVAHEFQAAASFYW